MPNPYFDAALKGLVAAAQNPVAPATKGTSTSEFWLNTIGAVAVPVAMSVGAVSPTAAGYATALLAVYTLSRGIVKSKTAEAQAAAAAPAAPAAPEGK